MKRRLWSRMSQPERDELVAQLRIIVKERGAAIKWKGVARELNVSNIEAARGVIDPEWYAWRNDRVSKRRKGLIKTFRVKKDGGIANLANRCGPPASDVAARLAEIPEDTRDLTAFMFGDPIPGRRAIDFVKGQAKYL
jgi:hypothetical protein